VTFSVSPFTTARSPGDWKSPAENSTPVVPPLVLLEVKNAPPTVSVPFMLNTATEAVLLITEGSAVVAAPNVHAGRVAWLYAVISVQPACDAIVSPAAGSFVAAAPYKPKNQPAV